MEVRMKASGGSRSQRKGARSKRWLLGTGLTTWMLGACGSASGSMAESAMPADCAVGTEGCACTKGGSCDPGLNCASKVCVSFDPPGSTHAGSWKVGDGD